ncbi:MAG TPA: response regulator [Candidatus Tumulicola sp.]|nr:response regulator [Candidatus Tumulicola sp.]
MRKQILVIDDNVANLRLFEILLRSDYVVETAADAPEALAVLRRFHPDLILMDVQLPGMDGISLTRHLRTTKEYKAIPIVALTAYAMLDDRKRALEAGCDGFISKPVDTRTFIDTVERHLEKAS